ncbi:ABC transporter ATP-binding protein [Paracandidimonas soli]|uniref:ABC transporter ATP-binding protein n=1 Tax=Paracandidimonas soli TaxID=1917182 RepID=UPI00333EBFA1
MLQLSHLRVAYGDKTIIEDLSASDLNPGQLIALLGPNGSGKSTLLKAVAGLIPVRKGSVVLDGRDLTRASFEARAEHVVYLPQTLPAATHLRVFESVLVAANASRLGGRATEAEIERVNEVLQRIGIAHLALRSLGHLSGGQRQLVGLAQALIRRPRLLLLDEPLSALDLNFQFHVMDLLRQETQQHQMITIVVLHDLNVALRHTDRTLLLRSGNLVANGAPLDVITPESLASVYGVCARVEHCSRGRPLIMLDGLVQSVH